MILELDWGQIAAVVVAAIVIQAAATGIAFLIFRTQAGQWHNDNQRRFGNIESALGIENPDETAFIRRSEAESENERVWSELRDHDVRIHELETTR